MPPTPPPPPPGGDGKKQFVLPPWRHSSPIIEDGDEETTRFPWPPAPIKRPTVVLVDKNNEKNMNDCDSDECDCDCDDKNMDNDVCGDTEIIDQSV